MKCDYDTLPCGVALIIFINSNAVNRIFNSFVIFLDAFLYCFICLRCVQFILAVSLYSQCKFGGDIIGS